MRREPPDLSDLVGDEGPADELERLRRAHELLVAAGPPPELSGAAARPPRVGVARLLPRRRLLASLAAAAALAGAAFGVGYAVSPGGEGFRAVRTVPMHGLGRLIEARAELRIGSPDAQGNIPIEMVVEGLPPLPAGGYYELYLSKKGKPRAPCGTFRAGPGRTRVRLSIAYRLEPWGAWWDGWVITAHRPGGPRWSEILLTT